MVESIALVLGATILKVLQEVTKHDLALWLSVLKSVIVRGKMGDCQF